MKIALIGAAGRVGSRILNELLNRGHEVTGIVPHPDKLSPRGLLKVKRGDVNDKDSLAALLAGHDAVISAVPFLKVTPGSLIAAVKQAGVSRLLVVGGAGSLEVAPGVQVVESAGFPASARPESLAGRDLLNALRQEPDLDWTFLSPSAEFIPGERTGKFRLGTDQLLVGDQGKSWISFEDFAIALVDEVEAPKHSKMRFTVGY